MDATRRRNHFHELTIQGITISLLTLYRIVQDYGGADSVSERVAALGDRVRASGADGRRDGGRWDWAWVGMAGERAASVENSRQGLERTADRVAPVFACGAFPEPSRQSLIRTTSSRSLPLSSASFSSRVLGVASDRSRHRARLAPASSSPTICPCSTTTRRKCSTSRRNQACRPPSWRQRNYAEVSTQTAPDLHKS